MQFKWVEEEKEVYSRKGDRTVAQGHGVAFNNDGF